MKVVEEFEELLESKYVGCKAIAVNSGTSALIACLKSLNLCTTDEVVTSPFTFQATSDAIILAGGYPIFADIDPKSHLITPSSVDKVVSVYTKAIIPVNLFGRICSDIPSGKLQPEKAVFCPDKSIPIIEDSAQCFLNPCNQTTYTDAQCFSFYRTKNLQCGEGGAVLVKDGGLLDYDKIWSICNNGRRKDKPKYEHYEVGYNFRMSEHSALMLYNQLKYHAYGIKSEIGIYDESNGYYPRLTYQQPSYEKLGIIGNCPIAEALVKEIQGRIK